MNQLTDTLTQDTKSFMIYVERAEQEHQEGAAGGYCAPYSGKVCRSHLQGRGLVWFDISQDNAGGWLNEEITSGLQEELIDKLQEPCRTAAQTVLCRFAFPSCIMEKGVAAGLPICYEDCIALRQHFCYSEWEMILSKKKKGVFYNSRGHFRLPDCDDLPSYASSNSSCTNTGVTDMRWDLATR
ncbi:tyrosine-protein kinase transmembrane receptor Ror2 [Eurytemora carolleeae]|uniref:tyrosine-protein kinase transmembrane receptor Ror2 n=1 Tax=Eurytemora carolleeae TaxID=1294199 RepID=UPI000C783469|nr:tyrosine-protein kinase transmembrane receptor Ror2 [Eurytemora carolleeae]|eukprot:XP_023341942.1 tyrosine-protein kinase transmembrane receptor Ror2-like [Eurytemora affinis]